MYANIIKELENSRRSLLDLSLRNRLLNFKLDGERTIRTFDLPDQVYGVLVKDKKSMKFLASKELEEQQEQVNIESFEDSLAQPEDDLEHDREKRHSYLLLQTKLSSKKLQTRLLRIETEARVSLEEQGTNVLHLALGFIKWYDREDTDTARYAPLVLIPAILSRDSAASRFKLAWSEEDIATNESLAEKLMLEHGIELPRIDSDAEDWFPSTYYEEIRKVIQSQSKWELIEEIALGFFSFAKLLMWRDLDPGAWPKGEEPHAHPIIGSIIESRPLGESSPHTEDEYLDNVSGINNVLLVNDADSSQMLVILDTMEGRNLAVTGPPGTGKSQTIANIIANAIANGKTVLFVAEKLAALEVVKRRLDRAGVGDACLELHSFKARKSNVICKLKETLEAARPIQPDYQNNSERVSRLRDDLNEFALAMNKPVVPGGLSPHKAIGLMLKHQVLKEPIIRIRIPEAGVWTHNSFEDRLELLRIFTKHLSTVGNPKAHPWRGTTLDSLLPMELRELSSLTESLLAFVNALHTVMCAAIQDLEIGEAQTLSSADTLTDLCTLLSATPHDTLSDVANSIWEEKLSELCSLTKTGCEYGELRRELLESVKEASLTVDYSEVLNIYRKLAASPFRLLHREFTSACRVIKRACLRKHAPKNRTHTIELLEKLITYERLAKEIDGQEALGRAAFSGLWIGQNTDWYKLHNITEWITKLTQKADDIPSLLSRCEKLDKRILQEHAEKISNALQRCITQLEKWAAFTHFNSIEAFGEESEYITLEQWIEKLRLGAQSPNSIFAWIEYRRILESLRQNGIVELSDLADNGTLSPDLVLPLLEYKYGEEVLRLALGQSKVLRDFGQESHEQLIAHFKHLDRKLMDVTRQFLAATLWESLPQRISGNAVAGPHNYLMKELKKKKNLPAIRKLIERSGEVVQRIKPCFMMSPMSVAQFLPPGRMTFDLIVIDEASQMKPEDALGAIARCKQCVIVGDEQQLPPTSFFDKLVSGVPDDEQGLGDVESILTAVGKVYGSSRMLRWHYRSRHESLIAFSNKEFYESKLNVFPSPDNRSEAKGVVSHYVAGGVYGRGDSRKNFIEADAVALAVMEHADKNGDLSLGVVALSTAQQQAIEDKLEEYRRRRPELESFFCEGREERFFVKNLETVQGDERDVIFISVGYGKDANGFLRMNFGPVNQENGYRRLNVLITRARHKCEVFHSLKSDEIRLADIPASDASRKGRVVLRNYLNYAETGNLYQPSDEIAHEADSLFEEEVAKKIEQEGFIVHKQVGVAGFRIDLAVVHPQLPGKYVLGIECDGESYHKAKSARDRDRLRQEVLEGLGWTIHRIWSLEWLRNPEKELIRVLRSIEKSLARYPSEAESVMQASHKPIGLIPIKRSSEVRKESCPFELVSRIPYKRFESKRSIPFSPSTSQIAELIIEIVQTESPIHPDELIRRFVSAWGFKRARSRLDADARLGINYAISHKEIVSKSGFLWVPGMDVPPIRDRTDVAMSIDMVSHDEINAAADAIRCLAFGINEEALVTEVARCLGYRRVGANVRMRILSAITQRDRV